MFSNTPQKIAIFAVQISNDSVSIGLVRRPLYVVCDVPAVCAVLQPPAPSCEEGVWGAGVPLVRGACSVDIRLAQTCSTELRCHSTPGM